MRNFFFSILLFAMLLTTSCSDEAPLFTLPYARVYFAIDTNGIDSDLTFFSHKTFTAGRRYGEFVGYGGLLLFRNNQGKIFAYDLCCPHEKDRDVIVKPTENGEAVCPKCGSTFVTMYGLGSVKLGVSNEPLQMYSVIENPQRKGLFRITN